MPEITSPTQILRYPTQVPPTQVLPSQVLPSPVPIRRAARGRTESIVHAEAPRLRTSTGPRSFSTSTARCSISHRPLWRSAYRRVCAMRSRALKVASRRRHRLHQRAPDRGDRPHLRSAAASRGRRTWRGNPLRARHARSGAAASPRSTTICAKNSRRSSQLDPGILVEDKGFSIAIHYRLVAAIRRRGDEACRYHLPARALRLAGSAARQARGRNQAERLRQGHRAARADVEFRPSPAASRFSSATMLPITPPSRCCPISMASAFRSAAPCRGLIFNFDGPQDVRLWLGTAWARTARRSGGMTDYGLDLALIGNGRTAALLEPGSRIVWWCFPRFDSDPVLCRLLAGDEEKGFTDVVVGGPEGRQIRISAQHADRGHRADRRERWRRSHHRFRAALPESRPHLSRPAADTHHRTGLRAAAHHHPLPPDQQLRPSDPPAHARQQSYPLLGSRYPDPALHRRAALLYRARGLVRADAAAAYGARRRRAVSRGARHHLPRLPRAHARLLARMGAPAQPFL